jgi:ATP-dependent Clp protease ATP-binding subunit ClpA
MFERFTDQARRVVVQAQEEARNLGHNYIGTEHILLGLLVEREGLAAQALSTLGISLDTAREQVVEIAGAGTGQLSGHVPFTPRTKKVLELSLREAQRLGHDHIGTEHILLGLIREADGVGAQILKRQGASLDRVQEQVLATVRAAPAEEVRRVSVGRMPGGGLPPTPSGTLRAVMSRLDEIAERLSGIENLLAEMRDPAARAAQKPPSGQGKPAGEHKPPAGGAEPAGEPEPAEASELSAGGAEPAGEPEPPAAEA